MLLVVDLDGTLLKSDMLYECFWSAFGADVRGVFRTANSIGRGRAHVKQHLASIANIDVSTLPYDEGVIAYIKDRRKKGDRVHLVTASNQALADNIAKHLKLFDEVYGSDERRNLKGLEKANFLKERFGEGNFCYVGDSVADLYVWKVSRKIVTVNVKRSLRQKVENLGITTEHLTTDQKSLRNYVKALRPHQWLKNALVFIPLLAAHQAGPNVILLSLLAFVAFNFTASSVYFFNDLVDLTNDRAHPRKRCRPFASGAVPIAHGSLLAIVLLIAGALLAGLLGWNFFLVMVGYFLLTTLYSFKLKQVLVADICLLAGLYTIRIIAGSVATDIALSIWLIAFSIFFFFSLAAVKRQAELVDLAKRGMLSILGRSYKAEDLPIVSSVALSAGYVSVLILALYINAPSVQALYSYPHALWGICCVLLYWITRLVLITHRGAMHDDPVVFAVRDKVSQLCLLLIIGFASAGVFL